MAFDTSASGADRDTATGISHHRVTPREGYRAAPVHLIGVSIPRSGHNLLVRMLRALFRGDLFYCEYYSEPRCCRTVPCSRRGTSPLSLQKSHDFDLDIPKDLADATYLIQHRAPVPAALSARELYAGSYGHAIASERGEYAVWLGRDAEYYLAYHRRWIEDPPRNSVLVDYADLAGKPVETLTRVLARAGIEVAPDAIDAAVAATIPCGGIVGERPYTPRSIEGSRYLDRELLAIYESILVDCLPHLAAGRVFEPVDYRGTLVWHVFEARQAWRGGDLQAALALVDGALDAEPGTGLLLHERATILQALGEVREAQAALSKAVTLPPAHPQLLSELATVSYMLGEAEAARGAVEALSALLQHKPSDQPDASDVAGFLPAATGQALDHPGDGPLVTSKSAPASSSAVGSDIGPARGDEFRQEAMVADLAAIAEERLQLIRRLDAEAARTRETLASLGDQLLKKEVTIAELAAAAEERLQLIHRLDAEAARMREALEQQGSESRQETRERLTIQLQEEALRRQVIQLQQKDLIIADLTAAAEKRRRRIEQLAVEHRSLRQALKSRSSRQQQRGLTVANLAAAVRRYVASLF